MVVLRPVTFKVDKDMFVAILKGAQAEGVSVSEFIRRAIVFYLGSGVVPKRESDRMRVVTA